MWGRRQAEESDTLTDAKGGRGVGISRVGGRRGPRPLGLVVAQAASRVRTDVALGVLDGLLTAAAYASMLLVRFEGSVPQGQWQSFLAVLAPALVVHLASNWMWGLYGRIWRHASVQEARCVLLAGAMSTSILLVMALAGVRAIPLSVVGLGGFSATMLVGAIRFQSRLFAFNRGEQGRAGLRVAIVGAGDAGASIVQQMLRAPSEGFLPVVILDDDPRKQGRSLLGVPVAGGLDAMGDAVERFRAHQVLLTIPSADQSLVRRVATMAEGAGVPLKLLPGVGELVGGRVSVRDVRDLQIEDLLGRQQVVTDLDSVAAVLGGRRVMITGGGGSIGAEIARQVVDFAPEELVLLDHDETHLHDTVSALRPDAPVTQVLADVRDAALMMEVFHRYQPSMVFHAAAHKHVPLLETHPAEAILTNVLGTRNVVVAAEAAGVERFLFVSTDKAVKPTGVMGASKRLGEQVVLTGAGGQCRYTAVRFGNVLGSRGSVIPTFARQIALGGPVTVTDARMTRFFMSLPEAVQLVLQAVALSEGGEVFMLEMGEPMKIKTLAERMIRLTGREVGTDIEIRITGIRPGEKLAEELSAPDEAVVKTSHPSILKVVPPPVPKPLLDASVERLVNLAVNGADVGRTRDALLRTATGLVVDLNEVERSIEWSPSTT